MRRVFCVLCLALGAFASSAEVLVINGRKYECRDGQCRLVEEALPASDTWGVAAADGARGGSDGPEAAERVRIAQGYMRAEELVAFLEGGQPPDSLAGYGVWATLLLALLGGLAMNLTPCVLPMAPVSLMIVGRSARRGLAYGLGIAVAYGLLGVGAALGGLAFGAIQSSPWFNLGAAAVFVGLALALFDVWFLDLSRFRPSRQAADGRRTSFLLPFLMGAISAVLAGACVAPVLVSALLLTADLVAKGNRLAALLPFVMGVGMALPWPFAGAGMKVLPKPGAWMKAVNRVFAFVVLGFAVYYGSLAWRGFAGANGTEAADAIPKATPSTFRSVLSALDPVSAKPVFVDCWASWCKSCAAMERVLAEPQVKAALSRFTVVRLQAEDIAELRALKGFDSIRGLPAFVILE